MRAGGRFLVVLAPFVAIPASTAASADLPGEAPGGHNAAHKDGVTLTIEATVAVGLDNNPRLRALETETEVRTHRIRSLDWIDNPEVHVRNLASRAGTARFDELEIGIRWRPPSAGEAGARRQRKQVALWERKVEAVRERHWLASRVRRSCADIAMHAELARIAAMRVENENLRISQIETMMDLGRRSIVYFVKAKTAVAEARQGHLRSLHALREEERRLRRLTGISTQIQVLSEPLPEVALDEERLLGLAYANRPELRLAEEQRQLALERRNRESWRRLPQLSFLEVSRHFERSEGDWHELRFGLELPLFNRNAGNLAGVFLAVSGSGLEVLSVRERIAEEVRETLSDYTETLLARDLTLQEGEAVIQASSLVIAETRDYPTVPADEILELERTIMDARVAIAESQRELAHALYFLYYELGIEDPGVLQKEVGHDGS